MKSSDQQLQELSAKDLPVGYKRFLLHLSKLQDCLKQSSPSENVALSFYKTLSREYLFYLESLSRLYRHLHNKKKFDRLNEAFKLLEDQLGRIDFYDGWVKEFSRQQNFPPTILENFKQHMDEEVAALQKLLDENEWIQGDYKMMQNILSELKNADWLKITADRRAIAETIVAEIEKFYNKYEEGDLDFQNIENGVHEFRREIRWFSIYAQALDGLIQLKQISIPAPKLKDYLTNDVINSPYNKLPEPESGIEPLYIEAPNFYALSWIINEIGQLKDDGLRMHALITAAIETKLSDEQHSESFATPLALNSKYKLNEITERTEIITDKFIHDDKVLKRIRNDIKRSIN